MLSWARRHFSQAIKLTDYAKVRGWSCKIKKPELLSYLDSIPNTKAQVFSQSPDCYIKPIANTDLSLVSSIDFFYPIVDDPFKQGQLAVANVLSDLYAMGVTEIDHFLAILGLSDTMNEQQRKIAATEILKGMESKTVEAKTLITGGQTVFNPWVITGGTAVGLQKSNRIIKNDQSEEGDVILLTKPIGTKQITDLHRALQDSLLKEQIKSQNIIDQQSFMIAYNKCVDSMTQLNLYASKSIQKFFGHIKASTDVTGFGLAGHSDNLVQIQKKEVDFLIESFPVFEFVKETKIKNKSYKLLQGLDPETSGGLFIVMKKEIQKDFQSYLFNEFGVHSWCIGKVVKGSRRTIISKDLGLIEV